MENYVRGQVLGKGSFGSAVLCASKIDGNKYVIKEVDISRMPKSEREAAEQEAKLLMALKHPNIVRCKECFTSAQKLCIVMDWCSEGDVYGILQKRKGQQLPEDTVLDWFVQICLGLKHVHDRKILHRDIKTQNIFVSSNGLLKLGDFGVSKVLSSTLALATTAIGTPYYLSPEICQNRKYNQKSDIWSLGCVLYEMATMRHAFEAPNMRALIQKIIKGSFSPISPSRSPELRQLVTVLLTLDARRRPGINEVLAMPVMQARITRFLSRTLQHHEFSHTVIHGKPEPGRLVVAAANIPPASNVAADAAAKDQADGAEGAAGRGVRLSAPPAVGGLPARPAAQAVLRKLSGPALGGQHAAAGRLPPVKPPAVPARSPLMSPPSAAPAAAGAGRTKIPKDQLLPNSAAALNSPTKSPSRALSPTPSQAATGQHQQKSPAVSPMVSPSGAVSPKLSPVGPSPVVSSRGAAGGAAAGAAAAADAIAAARQRAQQAQQERGAHIGQLEAKRAAKAEAASKAAADAYQQRQAAAAAAAAEVARLRAADEKKAAEAAAARQAAEKKRARLQGEQRKAQEAQEAQEWQQKAEAAAAAKRAAADARAKALFAAKRAAHEAQAKARAQAEAQGREAAAAAREHEREQMRKQLKQQKQEFMERQHEAAANRQKVEQQMRGGGQGAAPADVAADNKVPVLVAARRPARKPWSPPRSDDDSNEGWEPTAAADRHWGAAAAVDCSRRPTVEDRQPVAGRRSSSTAGDELSAQQRREVWVEMQAAAQRNKQQQMAAHGGGLAAFLGADEPKQEVPPSDRQQQRQRFQEQQPHQQQPRQLQQQQNRQPEYDRQRTVDISKQPEEPGDPRQRRWQRLEAEREAREEQLRQFQKQHWLEVKQAAARNRAQLLGELANRPQPSAEQLSPREQTGPIGAKQAAVPTAGHLSPSAAANGHNTPAAASSPHLSSIQDAATVAVESESSEVLQEATAEFAAMVADMQNLVLSTARQQQLEADGSEEPVNRPCLAGGELSAVAEGPDECDDETGSGGNPVEQGRFMLDGKEVQLPVRADDSLGLKVEALRTYLEEVVGTDCFLRVYHRLESLAAEDEEEEVNKEFLQLLGAAKLQYLQLVHQLIVAEECMHAQQA